MKIAIIRSCDRDDLQAALCFATIQKYKVTDVVYFFHEGMKHPFIHNIVIRNADKCAIVNRAFCDNFGGEDNILTMLRELNARLPKFSDADEIIYCDSDIIFTKNPFDILPKEYDHAGYYNQEDVDGRINGRIPHVSGQLNIIKGWLWNAYLKQGITIYPRLRALLDKNNYSIADDSIFSVFSYLEDAKLFGFKENECWLHYKIKPDEYNKYA